MKTMTKVLAVAVLALALAAPVKAACGTNAIISTIGSDGTSYIFGPAFQNHPTYTVYSDYLAAPVAPQVYGLYATDPAPTPLGPDAKVTFWGLGAGDPAVGSGYDNGPYDMIAAGGVYAFGYDVGGGSVPAYSFWYGATINGSWDGGAGATATDGCVGGNNCMCLLITDEEMGVGTYAAAGAQSTANVDTFMNRSGTSDGGKSNAPILLVPIPGPTIVNSFRDGATNDVTFEISVGAPGAGDYSQDGCACGPTGYKVYQAVVPRGETPPMTRALGAWEELPGQPATGTPLGALASVTSNCGATDTDVYLTTQLIFDSGFGTSTVSGNSTRVQCGPALADPSDNRPGRPDRPGQDRPRGRQR